MTALTHIYTGNGKGKTTAALGLAMRFKGCGYDVIIVQFGKGSDTGELESLQKLDIPIYRNSRDFGFWKTMDKSQREDFYNENCTNFLKALSTVNPEKYTLLVLDEIISAYKNGAVKRDDVSNLLKNKPQNLELVLTGRDAPKEFIAQADYVSEIYQKKHPFELGISARKGVEY